MSERRDPMEVEIIAGLTAAGLDFVQDPHPDALRLDFYLPDYGVHIECKQYHSPRISEQMSRSPDVIVIQGLKAAALFRELLSRDEKRVA